MQFEIELAEGSKNAEQPISKQVSKFIYIAP